MRISISNNQQKGMNRCLGLYCSYQSCVSCFQKATDLHGFQQVPWDNTQNGEWLCCKIMQHVCNLYQVFLTYYKENMYVMWAVFVVRKISIYKAYNVFFLYSALI